MRCRAIDGLRGYAAASVIIFHAILHYNMDLWVTFFTSPIDAYTRPDTWLFSLLISIFSGSTPVIIFFILSGYVLSVSLMNSNSGYFSFIIKRIGRIYPSVIACTLLTSLILDFINNSTSFTSINDIFNNILLLDNKVLGVTWTLTIEMAFAFLVYPLCYLIKKFGPIVIFISVIYSIIAISKPSLTFNIPFMNVSLIFLISGMALNTDIAKSVFKNTHRFIPAYLILIISVGKFSQEWTPLFILIQALLCLPLVGALIYSDGGRIKSLLENKTSTFIGEVSYSLYLFSVPVGFYFYAQFPYSGPYTVIFGLFSGLVITSLSLLLSSVTYRFIEKPSITASKKASMLSFKKTS
ncbi:acyltransferase family protein [Cedecea davisae]|uniref:acyltransferase family protein n=1 Tax=Cedecea davisae TaxID=158484 RepID=UPI001D0B6498|nr:acyltransferase [Cedecea davisae]